jgi:hypothetical protein
MDTRYWGPSGWRLLHLIAQAGRGPLAAFFETLPYILPCKYCRHSLSGYIQADPIPRSKGDVPRWLWRIHNDVNAKLRSQRLPTAADPPFSRVETIYRERLAAGCTRTTFEGWEFLFSVAEAHPRSRAGRGSTPLQGAPAEEELEKATPLERNRWNVMTPEERMPYYTAFWELLPRVLPFSEWETAWRAAAGTCSVDCRTDCLKGVWGIRCEMERRLELLNRTRYSDLCQELRQHRSGCGKAVRGKTCRRKRSRKQS